MLTLTALLSAAIWAFLLFGWARFWRADQLLEKHPSTLNAFPDVIALVPARNEAPTIAACISGLLSQAYKGRLTIVLIDDDSADATADEARKTAAAHPQGARLHIVPATDLAPGWSGKLWALENGFRHADAALGRPAYYWLTDADIAHDPETLTRLVSHAETQDLALVSLMVRLHCETFWEHRLVPAFVFFFQMLYPFPAVNDPASPVAAAAGGCILLSAQARTAIGGLEAVHDQLIDDVAVGTAVKKAGLPIWLGLGEQSHSLRPATGLESLWAMVTRTAFTQLHRSPSLLAGTLAGLALTYLSPPLIALTWPWHGSTLAALLSLAAWTAMAVAYGPSLRYYARPLWEGLTLPAIAALYAVMTVHSAINHWRGAGALWKGRSYDA